MSLYGVTRIVAGLVAPGMLDLRSSTKKKDPKLKFPERKENKFVPKVYAKGAGTRKVNN
jgi:hypothetical protein|tara:strand:+ start:527 stop:703 length:177 start_codon:yes stop_codon:yes gene_type:complete